MERTMSQKSSGKGKSPSLVQPSVAKPVGAAGGIHRRPPLATASGGHPGFTKPGPGGVQTNTTVGIRPSVPKPGPGSGGGGPKK